MSFDLEISRSELISSLRGRTLIKSSEAVISCPGSVDNITYRDLLELYLAVSGVRTWEWVDPEKKSLSRQPTTTALKNVFLDVLAWPSILRRQSKMLKLPESGNVVRPFAGTSRSILFLRTDHWFGLKSGGSVGHLKGVISGFRNLGWNTHVLSSDLLPGVPTDDHFHLLTPEYQRGRNLPNIPELLYNQQVLAFIDSHLRDWQPAFTYQRYSLGNYVGAMLKRRFGIPLVCEYNGSAIWVAEHWEHRKLIHKRLLHRVENLNLEAADLVVVVSDALKGELVARGIDRKKIFVNPNGVDTTCYSPTISGAKVRATYALEGKLVIGFIGTFGLWHGAEVLASAFGKLLRRFPALKERVRLLLIGDGPSRPQVEAKLREFGVTEFAVLTGVVKQEEGPAHLAACDVFASPHVPNPDGSPFFGSPTKLFEYMAMEKGIVASELEQIGDILKHGRTAWMVVPGDSESLMLGLKTLLDDETLRTSLGKAARQKVLREHSWDKHTKSILEELAVRNGMNTSDSVREVGYR